jgi:glycosyltransferase involved in cell wall biosynthesis
MADTVSVIIPAYNAATHIERTIASALAQTHPPLEILVVDDGSLDRTANLVAKLPPPVRLIRKENGGPASARNLGAREAKGDWLALLDADDRWLPDKLRAQLICGADDRVGMVHCLPDHRDDRVPDRLTFDLLWERNWIINSSVLIRREAFAELGGFKEARELISVEDYNLWVRLAASKWQIVTCQQVLVHYRRGIGISSNSERFLAASLYNLRNLGECLSLDPAIVKAKENETIFEFGQRAMFERDLTTARQLFWRAFSDSPDIQRGIHLAISTLPRRVLDVRRNVRKLMGELNPLTSLADSVIDGASPADDQPWAIDPADRETSILDSHLHTWASEEVLQQPLLVTTVDAEEAFDWTRSFSRAATDVTSMRSQHLAHRVFERHGTIPTYMVDYPVVSQDGGQEPLMELLRAGLCDIGAQLHPWVTPPFIETVSRRNSYPGNLPAMLEFAKIRVLTSEIEDAFGIKPEIFRAGRYGVGPNTGAMLRNLGYLVDSSVMPHWSFATDGGPDFRTMLASPYWIDRSQDLLELPVSAAIVGHAAALPLSVTTKLYGPGVIRTLLSSITTRLGLLERIKLTPEGMSIDEAKRLVRHMIARGRRVFVLTYHSPSLEPGNTPYVQTQEDLRRFLDWLDEFYTFFKQEIGGACASWRDVRSALRAARGDRVD